MTLMIFGPKRAGLCLACQTPVYEVKEVWPDEHPLAGSPRRIGPMLDIGTQVEFRMSDGSEADIAFCLDCAAKLQPEHYPAIWAACVDHAEIVLRLAGRSANERKVAVAALQRVWPVAMLRKRRESGVPGMLIVDRR